MTLTPARRSPAPDPEQDPEGERSAAGAPAGPDPHWLAPALAVLAVGATVKLGLRAVSDPDAWWHLRTGLYVLASGSFSGPDPWVPTATRPFVLTQWLPEVVAAKAQEVAGLPAVAWLRCLAMLLLLGALVWACRRPADAVPSMIAAVAALVGAGGSLSERPQLVSFVLLAVTVGAWWRTATDLKPRWWLVPLTWLWACSHGLWVAGPAVGLVVALGLTLERGAGHRPDRRRLAHLLLVPALSVVAAALTPVGPGLLLTPFEVADNARLFVQEWQPTSARDLFVLVTLGMLAAVLLAWVRMPRRPDLWQVGLALVALGATVSMARTVPVGAIIAAPLFADVLQVGRHRKADPVSPRGRLGFAALLLAGALFAAPVAGVVAAHPSGVPTGLSAQLSALPAHTVVLNDFSLGGWLLWDQPRLVPVIDLRSEIYATNYVRAYEQSQEVRPGWERFVARSGARYALLREGAPLVTALEEELGWRETARNAGVVLLTAPATPASAGTGVRS